MELFITPHGQELYVHDQNPSCEEGCCIHNPSFHPMTTFPLYWREDRGIMERICPHGIGHPDPDGLRYIQKTSGDTWALTEWVHGCDGCCEGSYHLPDISEEDL